MKSVVLIKSIGYFAAVLLLVFKYAGKEKVKTENRVEKVRLVQNIHGKITKVMPEESGLIAMVESEDKTIWIHVNDTSIKIGSEIEIDDYSVIEAYESKRNQMAFSELIKVKHFKLSEKNRTV